MSKIRVGILSASSPLTIPDPGEALMSAMTGWWDAKTYIGSGNLLNKGTSGAYPMVPTTSPSFVTDHFVFTGTQSLVAANHAMLSFASEESFTVGVILKLHNPDTRFGGALQAKGTSSSTHGFNLYSDNISTPSVFDLQISTGTQVTATGTGSTVAPGTKALIVGSRDCVANLVRLIRDTTVKASVTSNDSAISCPYQLKAGVSAGGTFQKMDFYGAFIHHGLLNTTELGQICTYYGITP